MEPFSFILEEKPSGNKSTLEDKVYHDLTYDDEFMVFKGQYPVYRNKPIKKKGPNSKRVNMKEINKIGSLSILKNLGRGQINEGWQFKAMVDKYLE